MMQLRDVLLKATARQITWGEAAEIIGVSDRTIQKLREHLEREINCNHKGRRFKASGTIFRARIHQLENLIAVEDAVSGFITDIRPTFAQQIQLESAGTRTVIESLRRIESFPSRHTSVFLSTSVNENPAGTKRRGMGITPTFSNPVLRSL